MLPFEGRHIFSNYSFLVFHCTGNASKRSGLGFGFFTRLENQLQAVSPISEFTPYSQMMCACAMARSKNVIIIIIISITVLINIIVTNIITTTTTIIITIITFRRSSCSACAPLHCSPATFTLSSPLIQGEVIQGDTTLTIIFTIILTIFRPSANLPPSSILLLPHTLPLLFLTGNCLLCLLLDCPPSPPICTTGCHSVLHICSSTSSSPLLYTTVLQSFSRVSGSRRQQHQLSQGEKQIILTCTIYNL